MNDFERACSKGWNGAGVRAGITWDWLCENDPEAAVLVRRFLAGALREMREQSEAMSEITHTAVYDCYSLEPGEGFDEHPGDAAVHALIDELLRQAGEVERD